MISFLLAASISPALAPAELATDTVDLRFRSQRAFALVLPNETWSPLGSTLPACDGEGFAVLLDGGTLRIDTDRDGTADVEVAGQEGLVTLRDREGQPARAIRLKNSPGGWVWSTAGARVGKLVAASGASAKLQLIDQNNNGRYDDIGVDAMIVGRGLDACFLSEVVCLGGELLRLRPAADGASVSVAAYDGPVGTLDLTSSYETDAKLAWAVVKSQDGRYSFDLSKAVDGQKIPAGTYEFERGRVALGQNHAQIHRGRAKALEVPVDGTLALDWGGPVRAEFAYERSGGKVRFSPTEIDYYGTFGELYRDFLPLGKSPEFSVKDRETGEELVNAKFPGNS